MLTIALLYFNYLSFKKAIEYAKEHPEENHSFTRMAWMIIFTIPADLWIMWLIASLLKG